jgi:hypothetical protein
VLLQSAALLLLLRLLPPPAFQTATDAAVFARVGKTVYGTPRNVKLGRGLDLSTLAAALCWHNHLEERLLAVLHVGDGAIFAYAVQPISGALLRMEARCFQGIPALSALLLLRRLMLPALVPAELLRNACYAGLLTPSPHLGLQMEPPRRQEAVALLADLRLSSRWMFALVQPVRHVCRGDKMAK